MPRSPFTDLPVSLATSPMEAKLVDALPEEPGWQFEPKWDGFRCLAFRSGSAVELKAKSGKPLTRFFPEMAAALRSLGPRKFVLDGELVIPVGKGLSFDALQMRLHPAESRIRKLAAETPAILILFDCLMTAPDGSLLSARLDRRRSALERFFALLRTPHSLQLSPYTRDVAEARHWLEERDVRLDGVIAKRIDRPYMAGQRAMLKVKRRLRRGWVSLRKRQRSGRFLAARSLQRRGQARPRGFHRDDIRC